MSRIPRRGLLGHWPGTRSPDGRVHDRSPEADDGVHGRVAKWVWFTNPRAVHADGRTYVGYLGGESGADVEVLAHDAAEGTVATETLAAEVSTDDHTCPAVTVRNDGGLLAFYSKHDGPTMHYYVAPDGSLGGLERAGSFEGDAICYPTPVQVGDEPGAPVYLFYRDRAGTGDGHAHYRVSEDGGRSWSAPTRLVTAPRGHYSVYLIAAERDGRIHLFFTDAEGPSTTPKRHVLYAALEDGILYTADGDVIADASNLPVRVEDLEVVYDSGAPDHHYVWIWDAGVDADGNPAAVYTAFPDSLSYQYRYARWLGDRWRETPLADAGEYIGADPVTRYFAAGVAMPESDPDTVYASLNREDGAVLKRLRTDNHGRTFATEVLGRGGGDHFRPVVPRNAGGAVPVVWLAGAYDTIDGSQSVLRGLPRDPPTGGRLGFDGAEGTSLGIDLHGGRAFGNGLSAVLTFETRDPARAQTLADFGSAIELSVGDEPGRLSFSLAGPDGRTTAAWDGVEAGQRYAVEGTWDGAGEMALRVEDEPVDAAAFEGPLEFPERGGWTLGAAGTFAGAGLRGTLSDVRLYNRPLTPEERRG